MTETRGGGVNADRLTDQLTGQLADIVGSSRALAEPDRMAAFTVDWTGSFRGDALAVVLPADAAETAAVIDACRESGAAVHPQGGNTGMVGGSVPEPRGSAHQPGTVVISTRRMTGLGPVDQLTGRVEAGAGVTIADLQRHASAAGWHYGVDLGSRESATVGGTIATNAGGLHVCAFGTTQSHVESVEVVTAGGRVLPLRPNLVKDNTGYRLDAMMVGSEGTLGVITRARLRLDRPPKASTVILTSVVDLAEAVELVRRVQLRSPRLLAAEIMEHAGVSLVSEMAGLPWPVDRFDSPFLLLVEAEGPDVDLPAGTDAAVAVDAVDRRRLWRYRELIPEALAAGPARTGDLHKLDVSVPAAQLPRLHAELVGWAGGSPGGSPGGLVDRREAESGIEGWTLFGHLADGNVHVAIWGADLDRVALDRRVLELVASLGGSISGEHGIGRAKLPWLSLSRDPAEIGTMRAVKRALDPTGLLAPGVLLPPD